MNYRKIVLLIVGLFILSPYADFNRLDQATVDSVDRIMAEQMEANNVIGASIGLVKNGEIAYLKGYGLSDKESNIPATEYTMYRLASVSKPFSSAIAMLLWEKGDLDLNRNIRDYVPEYPEKQEGTITTHQILSHQSGIRHYREFDTTLMLTYGETHQYFDPISAIDIFKNGTLEFAPGTFYRYTTFGYTLLGAVIERAGAQLYTQQVRDGICHKLNLPFLQPEYQWKRPYPNETVGYDQAGALSTSYDTADISYKLPGGGFISTVIDLALFIKGFTTNQIFANPDTRDTMIANRVSGMGYGIRHKNFNGTIIHYHSGAQGKTESMIFFDLVSKDGVAFMCNTEDLSQTRFTEPLFTVLQTASLEGPAWEPIPNVLETVSLLEPVDNAALPENVVTIMWNEVPFATHYEVSYATDPSFSNPTSQTVRSTELTVQNLASGTTYYWRVKPANHYLYDTTSGPWSNQQAFTTGTASDIVVASRHNINELFIFTKNDLLIPDTGNKLSDCLITLMDLSGRVLFRKTYRGNGPDESINISRFNKGMYLLLVTNKNKTRSIKLINNDLK